MPLCTPLFLCVVLVSLVFSNCNPKATNPEPQPEDLCNCGWYKDNSCCFGDGFTSNCKSLNPSSSSCKKYSDDCHDYMVSFTCFQQCSPDYTQQSTSSGDSVKVCSNFADAWYQACKNDEVYVGSCRIVKDQYSTAQSFVESYLDGVYDETSEESHCFSSSQPISLISSFGIVILLSLLN